MSEEIRKAIETLNAILTGASPEEIKMITIFMQGIAIGKKIRKSN